MTRQVVLSASPAAQLFDELAAVHGHYCPMSTLGLRLGWVVRSRLMGRLQDAVYQIRTCAADGIRLALEGGPLQVEERGQHILTFTDSSGRWRVELRPEALRLAATYRHLDNDEERNALLHALRNMEESDLMRIEQDGESS